ncbi:mercuric reductase [Larkinella knui]|uniref:Mercuric reductase n=1 Tax=Larkinella knui TaxID=2025310 RepID=A0A3P1CER9_9BACT|nr:mercuric reductase [Larkinella knui]RRB11831.1 mercuric reductase [Larkinella knui]
MDSTTSEHFDAILIGVGQAGNPLASALAGKGWKTAVIERKFVGGTCVNVGCTPTKTLIASAQVAYLARRSSEFGIETGAVRVDLKKVMERKNKMVETSRENIEDNLAQTENLTLIFGEARFIGTRQVEVSLPDGQKRTLTANSIFINSGSRPRQPDLAGLDRVPWLTSTSIMELEDVPAHLMILGGGYISLEFGQMFRRFGSNVTIIEQGDQLLSREDSDVADEMTKILTDEGIEVYVNTEVHQVSQARDGTIELQLSTGLKATRLTGTHLLVAVGRVPNTEALNLTATGVETDEKGHITVNDRLETSQPGIYALGDCKGGPEFTHISYDDYRIVRQNLLENGQASLAGRLVPYTVFTDPQLGRIGLSEQEARRQGKNIKIATLPMTSVARAQQMGQTRGLMKVVIDAQTDQLLGAAILGAEGGEIMTVVQIAMMGQLPFQRIRDAIFAHPTLAESLNNLLTKIT